MAIWQDLVDEHGFAGRYASVKCFVAHSRGRSSPEAFCVIETAAGEEAQVDYGTGPMVRDQKRLSSTFCGSRERRIEHDA